MLLSPFKFFSDDHHIPYDLDFDTFACYLSTGGHSFITLAIVESAYMCVYICADKILNSNQTAEVVF